MDGAPMAAEAGESHMARESFRSGERWQRRPVLGGLVRALALAIPIGASVVTAVAFSRAVPRPHGVLPAVGWWALVLAGSTVVLMTVDRAARRLLPLATLLRLSMVFPDRAPSRFGVAFKAGTTRHLKKQLGGASQHGIDDEPARCAERVLPLVGVLSRHDRATRGHSERVRAFNDLIAEELRLPEADRDRLRWAALLHDVGKVEVPAGILNKPALPSSAEWEALRRHPETGARIAAPLRGWLGPWALAIEQHHERWDGSGYPYGLAGEQISLAGRIVAVADVLDVLTAPRAYRRPVSPEAARAELARHAGSQFDPDVVRALLNISLGKLRGVMGPISWVAQVPFLSTVPRLEGAVAAAGRSAMTAAGAATGAGALAVLGLVGPGAGPRSGPPPGSAGPGTATAEAAAPGTTLPAVSPNVVGAPAHDGGAGGPAAGEPVIYAPRPQPRGGGAAPPTEGGTDSGPPAGDGGGTGPPTSPPATQPPPPQAPLSLRLDLNDGLGAGVTVDDDLAVEARLGSERVSLRSGSRSR